MHISSSTEKLYNAARHSAVWMPDSEYGFFAMQGNEAFDLLQRITSNDVRTLNENEGQITVLLTDKARIGDLLLTIKETNRAFVLCSSSAVDDDIRFLKKYIIMEDVRLKSLAAEYTSFRVLGVRAAEALQELTGGVEVLDLRIGSSLVATINEIPVRIIKLPTIAELHYLVVVAAAEAEALSSYLASLGDNLPCMDDETYHILRIEAGVGTFGKEYSTDYNPFEAGLLGYVNLRKGCFVGQEILARLDTYDKVQKRLVGVLSSVELDMGSDLMGEGKPIGKITSTAFSPELGKFIGLAIVRNAFANPGTFLDVAHNESVYATVELAKLPLLQ